MKVRLSIWTFWICDSKTVNGLKAENCKNWKLTVKKLTLKISRPLTWQVRVNTCPRVLSSRYDMQHIVHGITGSIFN